MIVLLEEMGRLRRRVDFKEKIEETILDIGIWGDGRIMDFELFIWCLGI